MTRNSCMKHINKLIPALFVPLLISGCAHAQPETQTCFDFEPNNSYVLIGTEELPLSSFNLQPNNQKIEYANDTGGADISVQFSKESNSLVITYYEPGIDKIEIAEDIICSNLKQVKTDNIDIIKVSDGILVRSKPNLIDQLSYDGWIFLK